MSDAKAKGHCGQFLSAICERIVGWASRRQRAGCWRCFRCCRHADSGKAMSWKTASQSRLARYAAAVSGIEETALRALVKLYQVLPPAPRRRVTALSEAMSTPIPAGGVTVDAETLTMLAIASRDCEFVRFGYSDREGERTRRLVEPHALVTIGWRWYLVAFDPDRHAWRTFRVDRVREPRPLRCPLRRSRETARRNGQPGGWVSRYECSPLACKRSHV